MFLLIPNREFPLRLLIAVRKTLQILHRRILRDRDAELDVAFGVLVARLPNINRRKQNIIEKNRGKKGKTHVDFCIIGQRRQNLIQRFMHLLGISLEKPSTTADEKGVTGEDSSVIAIFHVVAYRILGMTWGVESSDFDAFADLEGGVMRRGFGYFVAVFATDDGEWVLFELRYVD